MDTALHNGTPLNTLFTEVVHFSDSVADSLLTLAPTRVMLTARKRYDFARQSALEMPSIIKKMSACHVENGDPLTFKTALWASQIMVQQSVDIIAQAQIRALFRGAIARTAADGQALLKQQATLFTPLSDTERQAMLKAANGHHLVTILGLSK